MLQSSSPDPRMIAPLLGLLFILALGPTGCAEPAPSSAGPDLADVFGGTAGSWVDLTYAYSALRRW